MKKLFTISNETLEFTEVGVGACVDPIAVIEDSSGQTELDLMANDIEDSVDVINDSEGLIGESEVILDNSNDTLENGSEKEMVVAAIVATENFRIISKRLGMSFEEYFGSGRLSPESAGSDPKLALTLATEGIKEMLVNTYRGIINTIIKVIEKIREFIAKAAVWLNKSEEKALLLIKKLNGAKLKDKSELDDETLKSIYLQNAFFYNYKAESGLQECANYLNSAGSCLDESTLAFIKTANEVTKDDGKNTIMGSIKNSMDFLKNFLSGFTKEERAYKRGRSNFKDILKTVVDDYSDGDLTEDIKKDFKSNNDSTKKLRDLKPGDEFFDILGVLRTDGQKVQLMTIHHTVKDTVRDIDENNQDKTSGKVIFEPVKLRIFEIGLTPKSKNEKWKNVPKRLEPKAIISVLTDLKSAAGKMDGRTKEMFKLLNDSYNESRRLLKEKYNAGMSYEESSWHLAVIRNFYTYSSAGAFQGTFGYIRTMQNVLSICNKYSSLYKLEE